MKYGAEVIGSPGHTACLIPSKPTITSQRLVDGAPPAMPDCPHPHLPVSGMNQLGKKSAQSFIKTPPHDNARSTKWIAVKKRSNIVPGRFESRQALTHRFQLTAHIDDKSPRAKKAHLRMAADG